MTDIPLPSAGDTSWSDWAGEQEELSDLARQLPVVIGSGTLAAALTAAIAKCQADNIGAIFIPAGTWDLDQRITFPTNIDLVGAGLDRTVIRCTTSTACIAFGTGGGTATTSVRGTSSGRFTVDGNGVATNPLFFGLMAGRIFESIAVEDAVGDGIRIEQAQNSVFVAVESTRSAGWNWVLDYGAGGLTFIRCQHTGGGTGALPNQGNLKITASGANTGGGYNDGVSNVRYIDCQFERVNHADTVANIYMDNGQDVFFYGGNITTTPTTKDMSSVMIRPTPGFSTGNPSHVGFHGVRFQGGRDGSSVSRGVAIDINYANTTMSIAQCHFSIHHAILRRGNTTLRLHDAGGNSAANVTNMALDASDVPLADTASAFRMASLFRGAANPDTSGATLSALETEVNEIKALLRSTGLMA